MHYSSSNLISLPCLFRSYFFAFITFEDFSSYLKIKMSHNHEKIQYFTVALMYFILLPPPRQKNQLPSEY